MNWMKYVHDLSKWRTLAVEVFGDTDENLSGIAEDISGDEDVNFITLADAVMMNVLDHIADYAENYAKECEDYEVIRHILGHGYSTETLRYGIPILDKIPELSDDKIARLDRDKIVRRVMVEVRREMRGRKTGYG